MSNQKQNWVFSFDMEMGPLKQHYKGKWVADAYRDIGNYLRNHGFSNEKNKQGSVYFTQSPISQPKAEKIIKGLMKRHPWFVMSCRQASLDIKAEHSLNVNAYMNRLKKSKQFNAILDAYMNDNTQAQQQTQARTRR